MNNLHPICIFSFEVVFDTRADFALFLFLQSHPEKKNETLDDVVFSLTYALTLEEEVDLSVRFLRECLINNYRVKYEKESHRLFIDFCSGEEEFSRSWIH